MAVGTHHQQVDPLLLDRAGDDLVGARPAGRRRARSGPPASNRCGSRDEATFRVGCHRRPPSADGSRGHAARRALRDMVRPPSACWPRRRRRSGPARSALKARAATRHGSGRWHGLIRSKIRAEVQPGRSPHLRRACRGTGAASGLEPRPRRRSGRHAAAGRDVRPPRLPAGAARPCPGSSRPRFSPSLAPLVRPAPLSSVSSVSWALVRRRRR